MILTRPCPRAPRPVDFMFQLVYISFSRVARLSGGRGVIPPGCIRSVHKRGAPGFEQGGFSLSVFIDSMFQSLYIRSAAMLAPWDKTSPRGRVEAPKPVSAKPSKLVPRDASRAAFFFPRISDALDAPHVFVLT